MWKPQPFVHKASVEVWQSFTDSSEARVTIEDVDVDDVADVTEFIRAQLMALAERIKPKRKPRPRVARAKAESARTPSAPHQVRTEEKPPN